MVNRHLWCLIFVLALSQVGAQSFTVAVGYEPQRVNLRVTGNEDVCLTLSGIEQGEIYELQIQEDREESRYDITGYPATSEVVNTDYALGVGTGGPVDLCIDNGSDHPGMLSFIVRRKGAAEEKRNALIATPSTNLDSLVDGVFRGSGCFETRSLGLVGGDRVLATGQRATQTGLFSNGQDIFGIEAGIILTTGSVHLAPGPNSTVSANGSYPDRPAVVDDDAQELVGAGNTYFDVAFVEFEFTPTTDTITFDYVYFSEEYCFGLNSAFGNDAVGFYLEGPNVGTTGRENIARLDNGDLVSATTLNHIRTPDLFIDNSPPGSLFSCTDLPTPPERLAAVNYDGFSTRMTATAAVTPCEEYTLKIIVVDSGDPILDSGVFLAAGSFTAGLIGNPESSVTGIVTGTDPVEGCDTALLRFTRLSTSPEDLAQPVSVKYHLMTTGPELAPAARNGLDFELPESPLIIPPGEPSATLRIPILPDADEEEGVESFVIRYDGTCDCEDNRDTFFIVDAPSLSFAIDGPATVCRGETVTLTTTAMGGDMNYSYRWPDGSDTPTVDFTGTGRDTSVTAEITDGCGIVAVQDIFIQAPGVAGAIADREYFLCGGSVTVPIEISGDPPLTLRVLTIDSIGNDSVVSAYTVMGDTALIVAEASVIRLVSVSDALGCEGGVRGSASVRTGAIDVVETVSGGGCSDSLLTLRLTAQGGNEGLAFVWSDDAAATGPDRTDLIPGTYEVTVTRTANPGCSEVRSFTLGDQSAVRLIAITTSDQSCTGDGAARVVAEGGAGTLSYRWSDGQEGPEVTGLVAGTYTVTISDAGTCELTAEVSIEDTRVAPEINITAEATELTCTRPSIQLTAPATAPAPDYVWRDTAGRALAQANTLSVDTPGTYILTAPDGTVGCTAEGRIAITQLDELTGEAPDIEITIGERIDLFVNTNRDARALAEYAWTNLPDTSSCRNCPSPRLRPFSSFTAEVTVTDTNDCTLTLRQRVFVSRRDFVYLPTAFSPANPDGLNDVYTVFGTWNS